MEALADMVATEVAAAVDLGDDGGDDAGGEDGEGGEEEEEDPNEFVHVDEKFYYLVSFFRRGRKSANIIWLDWAKMLPFWATFLKA
jgi:hypothetical protein